ncbi:MAG: xanthine dehydrogenase family protein molybdopterin-binding subunit [Desulfobacterales bacterium]|nr:xanthine dehydrogenase family protein molybdopterin-binding subunit [Desulfobacterales bacterium]
MNEGYRFIGKNTPRKDAADIVTGRAEFVDDMKIPNLLYARILRCPHPHALIKRIETRQAEALSGVEAVLTYKNVPDWTAGVPRHIRVLDQKLRFVGDAVALVAAKTTAIADKALELIRVEYELLPAVYDVEEALKPGAPRLYDQFPHNRIPSEVPIFGPKSLAKIQMGNVKQGFDDADVIVEGTCRYEGISNPLSIEPPGLIIKWDGPGKLTVWSATQSASIQRYVMQGRLGLPDIRSIGEHCGGSYGTKNQYSQVFFYAAALAKATGKAVKLFYSKEEQMGAFVLRLGSRFTGRVGMKKDGTVTAVSGTWFVNTGSFSEITQGQIHVGFGEIQLALRCLNWDLKPELVCSNRNASGTVRGFGGQELKSAVLPIISRAMKKVDLDPVAFFRKNYVKPGDRYLWRDGNWWECRGIDYRKAIDKGAAAFGWEKKWKGWLTPTAVNGPKRIGVGVGVHGNADVGEDESEAYVRLNPDATATIHSCVSECGTGQKSSLCKMAAEVLQLPLERINISPADTLVNPFEFGLVGSRGTYAVGAAVIAAAQDAQAKLFGQAAEILKVKPEDLTGMDGMVYVKDSPDIGLSWRKIMGITRSITGFGHFVPDFSVPSFLMVFLEVEVDTETGRLDLRRVVSATDVGQIIDPLSLEGQLYGGLGAAGIDTAIFEETVLDEKNGRLLNVNMIDYKWRTFNELPPFELITLETPVETHRFKAIGVGEIASAPGPSAVLMAVSNALGTWVSDYPVRPDMILEAAGRIPGGASQ